VKVSGNGGTPLEHYPTHPFFWSDFTVDTTSRDKPLNAELNFDVSLSLSLSNFFEKASLEEAKKSFFFETFSRNFEIKSRLVSRPLFVYVLLEGRSFMTSLTSVEVTLDFFLEKWRIWVAHK